MSKKIKVGLDEHGLIDGADAFRCVDTHGLPLEQIIQTAAAQGVIINCRTFTLAAKKAGWKLDKVKSLWREAWLIGFGKTDISDFTDKIDGVWHSTS